VECVTVLAEEFAVVAGEHDQCVLENPAFFEVTESPLEALDCGVDAVTVLALDCLPRLLEVRRVTALLVVRIVCGLVTFHVDERRFELRESSRFLNAKRLE
jgi:hypothetical protein